MKQRRYINPYKLFVGSFMPNWLLKRDEVTPQAKIVYARLCQYNGTGEDEVYPSQAHIAKATGISERHVRNLIEELVGHELIEVDSRAHGRQNVYRFLEHDWMEFDRNHSSGQSSADRNHSSGQGFLYNIELSRTNTQAGEPPVPLKKKSKKKELTPEQVEANRVAGEWFEYSKSRFQEVYPGYVFGGRQDSGLARIFNQLCKRDIVKAKAFLNCALADRDPFVAKHRHDPMFLFSQANRWLTASKGWSGFKPETDGQRAAREAARQRQLAEQERHRREAEEQAEAARELAALPEGDVETLRAAWLSTVPGDHLLRNRWAEADWRTSEVVRAGIYHALKQRRRMNAGGVL